MQASTATTGPQSQPNDMVDTPMINEKEEMKSPGRKCHNQATSVYLFGEVLHTDPLSPLLHNGF